MKEDCKSIYVHLIGACGRINDKWNNLDCDTLFLYNKWTLNSHTAVHCYVKIFSEIGEKSKLYRLTEWINIRIKALVFTVITNSKWKLNVYRLC
jgi:hypothetical protein